MNTIQAMISGYVVPGVYRLRSRQPSSSICRAADAAGWRCFWLDGHTIRSKAAFLQACNAAMLFPAYFGHNWDALDECITDLSWAPASGYVVVYDAVAQFALSEPQQWAIALDILHDAVDSWRGTATPMYVLLRGTRGTTPTLPLLTHTT